MDIRDWTVALIEPNKFEAQIVLDLLRAAGCQKVRRFADSKEAMVALELYPATIIIMEIETGPVDGVEWTKAFRRERRASNRKAPIFLMSHAVSRPLAESCRHAGANAIIGKPVSGTTLIATIKKVLANPRPFIDAENYVGPCRRAGIVTVGMKRRRSDAPKKVADPAALPAAVAAFAGAAGDLVQARTTNVMVAEVALQGVQALATEAGDGPMMRACAAIALLLANRAGVEFLVSLRIATEGLSALAALPAAPAAPRDAMVDAIRETVVKAARKAA